MESCGSFGFVVSALMTLIAKATENQINLAAPSPLHKNITYFPCIIDQAFSMIMGPYLLCFTASLLLLAPAATSACQALERAALLAFKSALREPYIGVFKSWSGPDCCNNWYGVTCDRSSGMVAGITLRGISEDMSHNNLKGLIPKSMSRAQYIGYLDVSYNHLCGRILAGSPFDQLDATSFEHNSCLCGTPLKVC